MDIKLENNKAIFTFDTDEAEDYHLSNFVVIKTMMNYDTPDEKDWFQIKPGLMGKVVGYANYSHDIHNLIRDDLPPDLDPHCAYVDGYLSFKHDKTEYETYKIVIHETFN